MRTKLHLGLAPITKTHDPVVISSGPCSSGWRARCHSTRTFICLFIWLKRLELQKAFSAAACASLDSIASGAAAFNRADNAAMPAAVRFVSPSHRVPAAAPERAAAAIQMPPRWQCEECTSAHLDDSKAVICAQTLSCSAENPALAPAVFNLGSWLQLKRAISYTDEGA